MSASVKENEFVVGRFIPTLVYVREEKKFHTRISAYNYFSELFPDVETGAVAHLWFFDSSGKEVGARKIPLPYRGQLQFDVSELGVEFEGTAGLALVPDTHPPVAHNNLVGTGYYVQYWNDRGCRDTSHEWEPMSFRKKESEPWLCLIRPLLFPDTKIVVMSSYYGNDLDEGKGEYVISLRNGKGEILSTLAMDLLAPRSCRRFDVYALFPDIRLLSQTHGALGIEVKGVNIQGPFTWVTAPSGDFNIHHFC